MTRLNHVDHSLQVIYFHIFSVKKSHLNYFLRPVGTVLKLVGQVMNFTPLQSMTFFKEKRVEMFQSVPLISSLKVVFQKLPSNAIFVNPNCSLMFRRACVFKAFPT